jgi:hypothetical protein
MFDDRRSQIIEVHPLDANLTYAAADPRIQIIPDPLAHTPAVALGARRGLVVKQESQAVASYHVD